MKPSVALEVLLAKGLGHQKQPRVAGHDRVHLIDFGGLDPLVAGMVVASRRTLIGLDQAKPQPVTVVARFLVLERNMK